MIDEGAIHRWGIVGHGDIVSTLAASVASDRVSHAYLITGPEGVGRTALAMALARALNCEAAPEQRPCNACDSCRRIERRAHPDVIIADMRWQDEVISRPRGDASRARQRLSIDAVRHLRQEIVTRPLQGRWKLQIIDDAERLSDVAPDAFLKTLEEPPRFAVIILIASSLDAVSETIRSRCRHIALGSVASDVIRETLLDRGVDEHAATDLARAARGRIAWALEAIRDPKILAQRRERLEEALEHVTTPLGRVSISGTIARDHAKKRDATYDLLDLWTGLWRDALLHRSGLSDAATFPEVADRLAEYAGRLEVDDLYRALWATRRCMSDLDANVQARIALHAMVMQWPE